MLGGTLGVCVWPGVARKGCKPGIPVAFAATSTVLPVGKRYDWPVWISPTLKSPNADSIEVVLSAITPTVIFAGAVDVGSM